MIKCLGQRHHSNWTFREGIQIANITLGIVDKVSSNDLTAKREGNSCQHVFIIIDCSYAAFAFGLIYLFVFFLLINSCNLY